MQPSFSPDGSQIAFVSVNEGGILRLMGATGEPGKKLADQAFNPSWSPDGKEILFATKGTFDPYSRTGLSAISATELANGRRRQLNPASVKDAMQPSVSPHGKRVAFWGLGEHAQRDIWTMGMDGTAVVQVTDDDAVDFNPVWSPDGSHLYFLSDRSGARTR